MKILIGSDVVPTNRNIELFKNGDSVSIIGKDLFKIWKAADFRIFNLETPLTNKQDPIDKQGPNFITPTSAIEGIKNLKPSLITLANNHILDQGEQGLLSTCRVLDDYGIPYIGAGENLKEAAEPYVITKDGIKVGIYTCAEHEFSIATEKRPGANPFDPLESLDHISNLKNKCDYVIVLYHGGKEHYPYPSPYLQKVCRKIIEKGADIVICQQSHCIGSYEDYLGRKIVYGQGNFIFNKDVNEHWDTGLLIEFEIKNDKIGISYIPFVRTEIGISLAKDKEAQRILQSFYENSKKISKAGFIDEEYEKLAKETINNYKRKLAGFGKWKYRIDRYFFKNLMLNKKYKKQDLLAMINYIECEAHRELLLEGLKGEIKSGR